MKYCITFLFFIVSINCYGRHRESLPTTEVGLMNRVLSCLGNKDSLDYFYLFPPFDSLWSFVMHNPDKSPEAQQQLQNLKEHPQTLLEFDPYYNHVIIDRFEKLLQKGEDSGIHWNNIVLQRYQLTKQITTQKLQGYDLVAPERFGGYIFVRDMLGRRTYCITISEIQKIKGYYFGGQVFNILEASTVEEYNAKADEEQKYFDWLAKHPETIDSMAREDSIKHALADSVIKNDNSLTSVSTDDDDTMKTRREVVQRLYYEGKFDEEIPVKLFVRYMKDLRSGKVASYDGLYKFGDQVEYVKLNITRSDDGKWTMEDEPPVGTLELELHNKTYTGSWLNNGNGSGYDVVLKQVDIPEAKVKELDNILEKGLVGSTNQKSFEQDKKKEEPEAGKDEGY